VSSHKKAVEAAEEGGKKRKTMPFSERNWNGNPASSETKPKEKGIWDGRPWKRGTASIRKQTGRPLDAWKKGRGESWEENKTDVEKRGIVA